MATLVDNLRAHLITTAIVRAPNVAGAGARPWLPPAWRHPDNGPVAPGDAKDQGRPATTWDDGLVLSIMHSSGIPPAPGEEEHRVDGVDLVMRGTSVPAIDLLERQIRLELLGNPPFPGGRVDWTMGGLYVIQCRQWKPPAPTGEGPGRFEFTVGYVFTVRHQ